jgi:hypothetical protein
VTSRQTAGAGFVFVLTFVAALLVVNNPDSDASAATFVRYYRDGGNRAHLLVTAALLGVAALAWLAFAAGLRERLADGAGSRLAAVGSAVTAALLCVCGVLVAAIPAAMTFSSAPAPGPDAARYLPLGGYLALAAFAMPAAGLTVTAVCVGALRQDVLPRPLAWAGVAAAVVLLASVLFFPMTALVLWVLAACLVLVRRPLRIPLPAAA